MAINEEAIEHLKNAKQAACKHADYELASMIREVIERAQVVKRCPHCGQEMPDGEPITSAPVLSEEEN